MACKDMEECLLLADFLHVLSPVFIALTAAHPTFKGFLFDDIDSSHGFMEQSSDDRSENMRMRPDITNARATSIKYYFSNDKRNLKSYSDLKYNINKKIKRHILIEAKKKGVKIPQNLINHFAWLCHNEVLLSAKVHI